MTYAFETLAPHRHTASPAHRAVSCAAPKPVSSAASPVRLSQQAATVRALQVNHSTLVGVTTEMLVWWFGEGVMGTSAQPASASRPHPAGPHSRFPNYLCASGCKQSVALCCPLCCLHCTASVALGAPAALHTLAPLWQLPPHLCAPGVLSHVLEGPASAYPELSMPLRAWHLRPAPGSHPHGSGLPRRVWHPRDHASFALIRRAPGALPAGAGATVGPARGRHAPLSAFRPWDQALRGCRRAVYARAALPCQHACISGHNTPCVIPNPAALLPTGALR